MMSARGNPVGLIIGLFAANIVYLLVTLVLSYLLGIPTIDLFSGPFSEAANSLVSAWVAVGAILGVVDVMSILGFIGSVLDAAGGR